jgi:hypothetical protein
MLGMGAGGREEGEDTGEGRGETGERSYCGHQGGGSGFKHLDSQKSKARPWAEGRRRLAPPPKKHVHRDIPHRGLTL